MQQPVVFSIIVPTYNRAGLISKTLMSLLNQEYKNYEVIVVDDGSTDNTEEVVSQIKDERLRYVKRENAERAAARNFGAAISKGDYLNFFDSDDLANANHLSEALKLIAAKNDPEWFHLANEQVNENGDVVKQSESYTGTSLNKKLAYGNILGTMGVFVRKDIFALHKFNEDRVLSVSEDYELWCRLAAHYSLYYSNTVTAQLVNHQSRSVYSINSSELINRINALLFYLNGNKKVVQYFGKEMRRINMYAMLYIALHLSNDKKYKAKSFFNLFKAMQYSTSIFKRRMFYATLRNIGINW